MTASASQIISLEDFLRVIDNILHCLRHGSKLGWMLDPDDYSVVCFNPQQAPEVLRGDRQLPIIPGVNLTITAQQIFAWLKTGHLKQSR